MVTAAQGQSMLIGEGGEIVRMHAFHHETDERPALVLRAEHAHSGQFGELFGGISGQLRIVRENRRSSDALEIINRRGQSDRSGDVGRASLEAVRRFLECALLQSNADDHLAAAVPRWHRLENLGATVKHADAGRRTHFVTGEGEEIATHLLHIDRQMPGALRRIDEGQGADGARLPAKLGYRIDRAERIRDMGESEQLHLRREQLRKLIERERAILAHRHEAQPRAGSFRQQLPRHEVAVMLHLGEQNHVAGAEKFSAPRLRHQVDALGRSAGENDLVRTRRAQIIGDALPRALVGLGRARAQFVQAAMHVGVVVLVIMPERIEHRARLLRRGRVVEIDQRLAMHLLVEDREVLANRGPIDGSAGDLVHRPNLRWQLDGAPLYFSRFRCSFAAKSAAFLPKEGE